MENDEEKQRGGEVGDKMYMKVENGQRKRQPWIGEHSDHRQRQKRPQRRREPTKRNPFSFSSCNIPRGEWRDGVYIVVLCNNFLVIFFTWREETMFPPTLLSLSL